MIDRVHIQRLGLWFACTTDDFPFKKCLQPVFEVHGRGLQEGLDDPLKVWVGPWRVCPSDGVKVCIVHVSVLNAREEDDDEYHETFARLQP